MRRSRFSVEQIDWPPPPRYRSTGTGRNRRLPLCERYLLQPMNRNGRNAHMVALGNRIPIATPIAADATAQIPKVPLEAGTRPKIAPKMTPIRRKPTAPTDAPATLSRSVGGADHQARERRTLSRMKLPTIRWCPVRGNSQPGLTLATLAGPQRTAASRYRAAGRRWVALHETACPVLSRTAARPAHRA